MTSSTREGPQRVNNSLPIFTRHCAGSSTRSRFLVLAASGKSNAMMILLLSISLIFNSLRSILLVIAFYPGRQDSLITVRSGSGYNQPPLLATWTQPVELSCSKTTPFTVISRTACADLQQRITQNHRSFLLRSLRQIHHECGKPCQATQGRMLILHAHQIR